MWTFDSPAVAVVAGALAWYLTAARRVRRGGGRWPAYRTLGFGAGLATVLAATCSPIGGQARELFSMYTIQVCLLLLICPVLLGSGSPLALAAAASRSGRGRRWVEAANGSIAGRIARTPGVGPLLLIVVTVVVFFAGPLTQWSVQSALGYHLLHAVLLATGLVFALPLTDETAQVSSVAYAAMLGLGFLEFLLDAVPGIALRLLGQPLAVVQWLASRRAGGPSPLDDQHLAGAWLWFFAEAGDLPFLILLMVVWIRSDAREARRVDAALDAAELRRPQAGPVEPEGLQRPWWESDPSVFGEARARRSGWRTPPSPDDRQAG